MGNYFDITYPSEIGPWAQQSWASHQRWSPLGGGWALWRSASMRAGIGITVNLQGHPI